jgi:hypothetical protein
LHKPICGVELLVQSLPFPISKVAFCIKDTPNRQFYDLRMYLTAISMIIVTVMYIPIRSSRGDPDADEMEDADD